MSWIRAVVAAGLSLFVPGAGHVLVRDWGRALLFGTLFVTSIVLLFPVEELWAIASADAATATSMSETTAEMMETMEDGTDAIDRFTLTFLSLFAAVHAGTQALGMTDAPGDGDDVAACPHCGKPLDEDLTFCHWCTTRLEEAGEATSN
ncbi:zinc ribbon domain-containing protein [Halovivax cerinus]|uniref:Zinc ribbon domain-containing protein n=1 Tax=Halovivax cerinus TaxID=1487865 RepID=A0ABD5NM91_9EURY|nr:zinc ribbon domain-containing protein [Halovivax cerinus]